MAKMSKPQAQKLQKMLNDIVKPSPPLAVDGIVGKKSKAALKLLQRKAGLPPTGEVDSETAAVITRVMKTGKVEKEPPKHFYKIGGKLVGMTEKQYAAYRKKLIRELKSGPLGKMRSAVVGAEAEWEHFDKMNKDQWFVSWCIETTRGTDLPPKSLIAKARKAYEGCQKALNAGDLKKFYSLAPNAEKQINEAASKMVKYRNDMIDGAGNWVTGLTFTKTASFTFVGVFAAPVAAGALGTGAVASAVIGGAAVAATESAAGEIGKGVAGEANWTPGGALKRTLIDAGVGGIVGIFNKGGKGGKHVLEAAAAKIAPKLAAQSGFKLLSKTTLQKATMFLITEGGKKTMEGAVKDTAAAIKGDPKMTMDKFMGNLANNFIAGAALGPLGKVIEKFAKNASTSLSPKDRGRIMDLVLKEMTRGSKGGTVYVDFKKLDSKTQALVEKTINDQVAKQLDNVLKVVYDQWKGPMSPQAFQKKVSEALATGPAAQKMAVEAAKKANKLEKAK
ncbi:MAG: peptidoglycan-binding domain-containing protein [Pseudomonadota bacterium]